MALPATITEALSGFHGESGSGEDPSGDLLKELQAQADRVTRLRQAFKTVESAAGELITDLERKPRAAELLDSYIEALRETEQVDRKSYGQRIREAEELFSDALKLSHLGSQRLKYANAFKAEAQVYRDYLNHLRDLRWQILALRTEAEDPGDSPIFDDPESLALYLEQHK